MDLHWYVTTADTTRVRHNTYLRSGSQGALRGVDSIGCCPESGDGSRVCRQSSWLSLYALHPAPCVSLTVLPGDFLSILSEIERNYLWVTLVRSLFHAR